MVRNLLLIVTLTAATPLAAFATQEPASPDAGASTQKAPDDAILLAQADDVEIYFDGEGNRFILDSRTGELLAVQPPRRADEKRNSRRAAARQREREVAARQREREVAARQREREVAARQREREVAAQAREDAEAVARLRRRTLQALREPAPEEAPVAERAPIELPETSIPPVRRLEEPSIASREPLPEQEIAPETFPDVEAPAAPQQPRAIQRTPLNPPVAALPEPVDPPEVVEPEPRRVEAPRVVSREPLPASQEVQEALPEISPENEAAASSEAPSDFESPPLEPAAKIDPDRRPLEEPQVVSREPLDLELHDPLEPQTVTEPEQPSVTTDPEPPTTIVAPVNSAARTEVAELQILLDRAGASPGVIDGRFGENVDKALAAYSILTGNNLKSTDLVGIKAALDATGGPAFVDYEITAQDAAGPFVASVPEDYSEKAKLEKLSFTSVEEMLAERFHMDEAYLRALNPDADFGRPGTIVRVAAVGTNVEAPVKRIIADKFGRQVRAFDAEDRLVAVYPATIGSSDTPSPTGTHAVARVAFDPNYTYNPNVNFKQGENDKVLTIPPGPNGPVGSIWIALDKPTYGIHGTPEPSKIGKTESHGCVRLTNWDAAELAKIVSAGVEVEFAE